MSNTLVIDTNAQPQIQQNENQSILGFRSVLPASSYTGENEDPANPLSNALDFRDNTKYSPLSNSGQVQIIFSQDSTQTINYFSFAIHNSQDAILSGMLEVDSGSGYEVVAQFASIKNNRPFLKYFGDKQSVRQRLTLNFTSKLFIGSINIGNAVVFNRPPSLGFQPGRFSSLDTVQQFTTEGNNFIVGRRQIRGFQSRGSFNYIEFSVIEDWFEEYMNHVLDSKTIYFKWNTQKDQTVYGLQNPSSLAKPSYVTSFHSNISFEINGYA